MAAFAVRILAVVAPSGAENIKRLVWGRFGLGGSAVECWAASVGLACDAESWAASSARLSGARGDDGFGAHDFVEGAFGGELAERLAQIAFEGVFVVAELGGAGVAARELQADNLVQGAGDGAVPAGGVDVGEGERASTSWWRSLGWEQVRGPARRSDPR